LRIAVVITVVIAVAIPVAVVVIGKVHKRYPFP
jgi:hypothetical protein